MLSTTNSVYPQGSRPAWEGPPPRLSDWWVTRSTHIGALGGRRTSVVSATLTRHLPAVPDSPSIDSFGNPEVTVVWNDDDTARWHQLQHSVRRGHP